VLIRVGIGVGVVGVLVSVVSVSVAGVGGEVCCTAEAIGSAKGCIW